MSNLKILFKNNVNQLLGRLQGKRKRASTAVALSLLILGMIGIVALYSFQAWSMFSGLKMGKLCVFHAVITTLTVLLIIGIMRVSGKTKGNDADFLLSLPIKKLVNKYLFDLFFSFFMLAPYIVLYEITAPAFSAPVLIFGFVAVLFLPLMSVGISQIMEFIVVRLFNKIKGGEILKSLVPTVIYIVALVLMLIKTSSYGTVVFESMEAYFADRWISNQVLTFIFDQTWVSIVVFACITILPAVVGTLLYINIYGKNYGVYSSAKTTLELSGQQSPANRLLKKEIKTYFTMPAYFVNTIIGPIMAIVLSIVIAGWGPSGILSTLGLTIEASDLAYAFALLVNLCISTTCISGVSVSLEGKSLWFMHAMPISVSQIFISKLIVPLIVVLPSILVCSVIGGIVFNSLTLGLIIFGFATLFLLITDTSGLMINLWLPKLEWENETQVVKQSLSVLISMLFNFVVAIIPAIIYLIFKLNFGLTALISAAVYAVILIVFNCLLFTTGKTLFGRLKQ